MSDVGNGDRIAMNPKDTEPMDLARIEAMLTAPGAPFEDVAASRVGTAKEYVRSSFGISRVGSAVRTRNSRGPHSGPYERTSKLALSRP